MQDKIIVREIRDSNGKLLGNITGRQHDIARYSNRDLAAQLERDRQKQKDIQNR